MPKEGEIPIAGLGGEGVPLLRGLDGVLTSTEAAMHSIRSAANDLKVIAERQGQTYGTRVSDEEVVARKGGQMSMIFSEVEDIEREAKRIPSTADRRTGPVMVEPARPQETVTTGPQERTNQETFEYYRDFLKDPKNPRGGMSLRNIRQGVGDRIMAATESTWGEQFYQGEGGEWVDEEGNLAQNAALMAFMRREKIAGAVRGFGQSLAKGETVRAAGLGAAPGVIAKGAGIVGAGLYAGQQAGDFFEGQRASNAEWQSMFGGSNLGATGQRIQQKMFGLSQFGFMDSAQAEQLFKTVSQQGLQGEERQASLDFATNMYSKLGMSVQQSTRLIELAAKTGQESLSGFAVALTEVSESAVEAGVNAEKARENFIQQLQLTTGLVGGGAPTAQAAGAAASVQAGLGREYQNIQFGFFDQGQIQRMATQQGVDYNTMVGMIGADPGQFLEGRVGMMEADVTRVFRPGMYERAKQLIENRKAAGQYDPTTVAQELLQGGYLVHMSSARGIIESLTGTRVQTDFEAALAIVALVGGDLNPEQAIENQQDSVLTEQWFDPETASAGEVARGRARATDEAQRGGLFGTGLFGSGKANDISSGYRAHVAETGQGGGLAGFIAGNMDQQMQVDKVLIETDEGPRVVDIADAIEHYGAQINRGDVQIVEGGAAGQTVAEAFGMGHGDPSVGSDIPEDVGVGVSAQDFERQAGVVLGLTPEARRVLQPVGSTGVTYDESWQPSDPHVTQESYPTGNAGG